MAFWEWQETYLINISEIDTHHQKLVNLLNNLYHNVFECNISEKQSLIGNALAALIDYSCYHFTAEEGLMLRSEYPGYMSHKEEHEQFKTDIAQLLEENKEGTLVLSFPVLSYLKDWLILHVIHTDKQFGQYFNKKMK